MKTNLDALFKTDKNLETEGIWMEISDSTAFRVKRAGGHNLNFTKLLQKRLKPYSKRISTDTMDDELQKKILVETFVDTCLIDWRGMEIDGVDTPYSKDVAMKLLLDPGYETLATALIDHAQSISNYREDYGATEELGNS